MTAKQARTVRLTRKQKARLDAMTDDEITAAARSDPDNPPLTDAELALMRRSGRPKADDPKRLVSLRLDSDVVERLRASGPGWQSRANAALRRAVKLGPKTAAARKRARG
jgi:uncharacterized protein (DUF4415 family)